MFKGQVVGMVLAIFLVGNPAGYVGVMGCSDTNNVESIFSQNQRTALWFLNFISLYGDQTNVNIHKNLYKMIFYGRLIPSTVSNAYTHELYTPKYHDYYGYPSPPDKEKAGPSILYRMMEDHSKFKHCMSFIS